MGLSLFKTTGDSLRIALEMDSMETHCSFHAGGFSGGILEMDIRETEKPGVEEEVNLTCNCRRSLTCLPPGAISD